MDEPLNPDSLPEPDVAPEQGTLFDDFFGNVRPESGSPTAQETEPEAAENDAVEPRDDAVVPDESPAVDDATDASAAEGAGDSHMLAEDAVSPATDEVAYTDSAPAADAGDQSAVPDDAQTPAVPAEEPAASSGPVTTDFSTAPSLDAQPRALTPVEVDVDTLDLSDPSTIPALHRPRPFRPPVVPLWVSYASIAVVLALIAGIGGYFYWSATSSVSVPIVIGLAENEATASLKSAGLLVEVTERRFSTKPRGDVLEQDPSGGVELKRGDTVRLIVSAGSEEFAMPDVVGDRLAAAQKALEDRGLIVNVTSVESGEASDTVLASVPGPGESVRTGEVVRLTVSKPAPDGGGLKPFSLQGVTVLIDPAPVVGTATDPAMDVTRRLRALLEAAGATVSVTRAFGDPPTITEQDRVARAKDASAVVGIGLSVAETGAAGRVVLYPGSGLPQVVAGSARLSSSLSSGLAEAAPPATSASAGSDAVLGASGAVWCRIRLGSLTAGEDQTSFSDPLWADKVARAVYTSIGQLYGLETSTQ